MRNSDWLTNETLINSGVAVNPANARLWVNKAYLVYGKGDIINAGEYLSIYLSIYLSHLPTCLELYCRKAIELDPTDPDAYGNLATSLYDQNKASPNYSCSTFY